MRRWLTIAFLVVFLGGIVVSRLVVQSAMPDAVDTESDNEDDGLPDLAVGFDELGEAEVTSLDGIAPETVEPDWEKAFRRVGLAYGASVVRCPIEGVEGDGYRLWQDERDAVPSIRWAWLGAPDAPLRGYPRIFDQVVSYDGAYWFLVEAGTDGAYVEWPGARRALVTWEAVGPGDVADCTAPPAWQPTVDLTVTLVHAEGVDPLQTNVWASCGAHQITSDDTFTVPAVEGTCTLAGYWSASPEFGRLQPVEIDVHGPTTVTLEGLPTMAGDAVQIEEGLAWLDLNQAWMEHDLEVVWGLIEQSTDAAEQRALTHFFDAMLSSKRAIDEAHRQGVDRLGAMLSDPAP